MCYSLFPEKHLISGAPIAQAGSNQFTEGNSHIRRSSNQTLMVTDPVTNLGKWKGEEALPTCLLNPAPWSFCYNSRQSVPMEQGEIMYSWEKRYWRLVGGQMVEMVVQNVSLLFSELKREKNGYGFLVWWFLTSLDLQIFVQ